MAIFDRIYILKAFINTGDYRLIYIDCISNYIPGLNMYNPEGNGAILDFK